MLDQRRTPWLHNLPVYVSSFIGRVQDSADVGRLLAESRLVTLTGAGGSGKTRLASRIARTVDLATSVIHGHLFFVYAADSCCYRIHPRLDLVFP